MIYTRDNGEYERMQKLLRDEAVLIDIDRAVRNTDGSWQCDHEYDLLVIDVEKEQEFKEAAEHIRRYAGSQVIMIVGKPGEDACFKADAEDMNRFATEAMHRHIFDLIERPYTDERFRRAVRDVIPHCPNRKIFTGYQP